MRIVFSAHIVSKTFICICTSSRRVASLACTPYHITRYIVNASETPVHMIDVHIIIIIMKSFCGGRKERHLTRRPMESSRRFVSVFVCECARAMDAWWYVRLKKCTTTCYYFYIWYLFMNCLGAFFFFFHFDFTEPYTHATHRLSLILVGRQWTLFHLWSSFACKMNNDRSACRFLKQRDLMTEPSTPFSHVFLMLARGDCGGRKKRERNNNNKNNKVQKREYLFTNHDTCCRFTAALPLSPVIVVVVVIIERRVHCFLFNAHIKYNCIYGVHEQKSRWHALM